MTLQMNTGGIGVKREIVPVYDEKLKLEGQCADYWLCFVCSICVVTINQGVISR